MTNSSKSKDLALIIVAAGSSSRMGGIKKEYLPLNGGTVLSSAAKVFLNTLHFSFIAVTFPNQNTPQALKEAEEKSRTAFFTGLDAKNGLLTRNFPSNKVVFVPGGKSRQESVYKALEAVKARFPESSPLVFIHDGARPFVTPKIVQDTFDAALEFGASVPGLTPVDTQNEIDEKGFISRHLVRSQLTAVQTPQVFDLDTLIESHKKAAASGREYTDDTEIWDLFSGKGHCKVVAGDVANKKITFVQDLNGLDSSNKEAAEKTSGGKHMIRTGLGYDKHALVAGRDLMLGGVKIESDLGEDGHSDGDVLLHAITDAVLGAGGLGDIGSYFPPSDPKWKDADSKMLLKKCWEDVKNAGWKLGNLDCVIALEKPKFLPHRQEVINSIAAVLGVEADQVFVKAKTGEKLGDVGQRRAVEVWATCLLER